MERSIRKYIKFGGKKTQNQVSFIDSLNLLIWFIYKV